MSWKFVKIGDACKTAAGGTPLKSKKEYYEGGKVPWLLSGEVSQGEIYSSKKYITKEGLLNSSAKIFPKNTVLVAMYGATAGQVGILRFKASTNQAVCGIYPNDNFLPEFIYYSALYKQKELIGKATGNAQPNISQTKIKNTQIPLIGIEEQKRIVAILDEAFAGIDMAIANTEKNLANARELFESYMSSVFTKRGAAWNSKSLGDLTEVQSGGTPLKSKKEFWDGQIPWYSSGELNDLYTQDPANQITELGLKNSNAKLFQTGSLLIGMYDTAALKMSILDRDAAFNQAIAGAKPNPEIDLIFIRHAINATKQNILSQRRGVRQKNLSLGKIKNIVIQIPKISEQQSIVSELSALNELVQRLEQIYQQKLTSLNELKQSLLYEAFTGQLTSANNPNNKAVA